MEIIGNRIVLRPAEERDRKKTYIWLTKSDVTASMMGPPNFTDHPISSWEEYCQEYPLSLFNSSGDGKGRNYIILLDEEEIGTIGYDLLDKKKDRVVLDIWMSAEKYCGQGYGSDALNTLCDYIHTTYGISNFIISPSARNKRAIVAYEKCGFQYVSSLNKEEQESEFGQSECDDNILMRKCL